jgi:hypothetical protein
VYIKFLAARFHIPRASGQHNSPSRYGGDMEAVATRDCHSEGLGLGVVDWGPTGGPVTDFKQGKLSFLKDPNAF